MSSEYTPIPEGYKRCSNRQCRKVLPATTEFFSRNKNTNDKLSPRCKECNRNGSREWRIKNPEKIQERIHNRTSAQREYNRIKSREWRLNNPERTKENNKRWYEKNKDHVKIQSKIYRISNSERINAYQKEWRKNNLEKIRVKNNRYRTRKCALPNAFSYRDWQIALDYFKGCCAVCGRSVGLWHIISMDHWIPLTDPNCPGTVPINIIPLCCDKKDGQGGCNNSKNNQNPYDWLKMRYGDRKARKIQERIQKYFEWRLKLENAMRGW